MAKNTKTTATAKKVTARNRRKPQQVRRPSQRHNPAQKRMDLVNEPPHYTQGKFETIEVVEGNFTVEEFEGFCKANAFKYLSRERYKGGTQDLEKAVWYLNRLIAARNKRGA